MGGEHAEVAWDAAGYDRESGFVAKGGVTVLARSAPVRASESWISDRRWSRT
jgi:hypothetical protein